MRKSIAAALALCAVAVGLVPAHYLVSAAFERERQERAELLAAHLRTAVVARLMEPVHVARAMANDEFLIDALRAESAASEAEDIARIQAYLLRIKESLSYTSACVVSDRMRRYYRDDEMHKIIDPEHDAHDVWFARYADGGQRFNINVYRDAKDEDASTVFVNMRIEDDDGGFLGVASIGVFVRDIIAVLAGYEAEYDVRINLTDSSGLVLLGTNYADIVTASLAYLVLSRTGPSDEMRYMGYGASGFAATSFVEELGWYFVVRSERAAGGTSVRRALFLSAALLIAVAMCAPLIAGRRPRAARSGARGGVSQTDSLTGLPNRNYFKDMYGERGVFNTTRYRCLAVFDIDFFKEANDSMNGDTALVSVVNHALRLLDNRGMVLRWGGDEFLVLFELPTEHAYALCRQFCRDVAAGNLVTVSVGLADVRLSDTIKKNYYRAAQCCYQVKEMGGNGVKKE